MKHFLPFAFALLLVGIPFHAVHAQIDCSEDVTEYCCGNNIQDGPEACDGTDIPGGSTCEDQAGPGYTGTVVCQGCQTIDTTACVKQEDSIRLCGGSVKTNCCGDGAVDSGEECDGTDFPGNPTCEDYVGEGATGTLKCLKACQLDTTDCVEKGESADDAEGDGSDKEGAGEDATEGGTASISNILQPVNPVGPDGRVERWGLSALIKGITSTKGAVGALLAFVLSFVGVVALVLLVMQGYKYMTGAGGGAENAKKGIANVVIGIIIIIGAWAIVVTVLNLGAGPGM